MKSYLYKLTGAFNNHSIKELRFKTLSEANTKLDNMLFRKDLEVSYVIKSENASTYVIDDYSRLTLERM